jgi:hypothetical protein
MKEASVSCCGGSDWQLAFILLALRAVEGGGREGGRVMMRLCSGESRCPTRAALR